MSSALIIAIPSKGRLQENTAAFFARAGLNIKRNGGARNYRGRIVGVDGVDVAFLSASEITKELAAGNVHLGVTGEDLVREHVPEPEGRIEIITPLGFGHADVVIAVPRAWIDVSSLSDLVDVAQLFHANHGRRLRVATKYANLTGRFFAAHMLSDYRIVESLGATEGAPAAGTADIIVDITSTGSTLTANDLKVPGGCTILNSEASLVASLVAEWTVTARNALAQVLDHVAAEERARSIHELRADWDAGMPAAAIDELIKDKDIVGVQRSGERLVLHIRRGDLHDVTAGLKAAGAARISVFAPSYVFEACNPLFDRLNAAITSAEKTRQDP